MGHTLLQKVWDRHAVRKLPTGQTQLFIGLHLIHEVTSPQAFDMLRQHGLKVAFPERTVATIDHIVPTSSQKRPFLDVMAEEMTVALEKQYIRKALKKSRGNISRCAHICGLSRRSITAKIAEYKIDKAAFKEV